MIKRVRSMVSLSARARRGGSGADGGHKKKSSMIHRNSEDEVQWEMLCTVPPLEYSVGCSGLAVPAWFKTGAQYQRITEDSPLAPVYSDMKLPFELWENVFDFLEDGYDIHALARTCRGLRDVSRKAQERHASWVRAHPPVRLFSYASICDALDLVSRRTPSSALAVRDLEIRLTIRPTREVLSGLSLVLRMLPNLRTLSLHAVSEERADMWLHAYRFLLATHRLPHLRAFSTSSHRALDVPTPTALPSGPESESDSLPAPALRTLTCGLHSLGLLCPGRVASELTHLHILVHVPQTLETVAALLGAQLVSLRLGVVGRLPDLCDARQMREVWTPRDVLGRFPRLRYIQMHMFEPDFVPLSIQWQHKRDRTLIAAGCNAGTSSSSSNCRLRPACSTPLTVAWVLEEEAWGTFLDPREPDQVRRLFEEVAFNLLRNWTPLIDKVVYGDAGVPDTCVRLRESGNGVVRCDTEEEFGEEYWRRV